MRNGIFVAFLMALALAIQAPGLGAPLLEGAAGKQAHTAMIARNLYRGRSTWMRPIVDDLGAPGYFVKEVPLVPGLAALGYGVAGSVDERWGRLVSCSAWAFGAALTFTILGGSGLVTQIVGSLWWILAPLALAYAPAFQTDPTMVTVSLAALLSTLRWRAQPSAGRATTVGVLLSIALLLKPHAAFWLLPSMLFVAAAAESPTTPRPRARQLVVLGSCAAIGCAIAGCWYAHAATIHLHHPAAGATVPYGWIDPTLLLRGDFYRELTRQQVCMVFTPPGLLLGGLGILRGKREWTLAEKALLIWGAGSLLQAFVFSTRLFDDLSRGTEYYQLPMIPVAGLLIGRGIRMLLDLLNTRPWPCRAAVGGLSGVVLLLFAAHAARGAMRAPARYGNLLAQCEEVRRLTTPRDEIFVLSDRGGVVLYYCDRRGSGFVIRDSVPSVFWKSHNMPSADQLELAVARARYAYVPFPELLPPNSPWMKMFEEQWDRVASQDSSMILYRKRSR